MCHQHSLNLYTNTQTHKTTQKHRTHPAGVMTAVHYMATGVTNDKGFQLLQREPGRRGFKLKRAVGRSWHCPLILVFKQHKTNKHPQIYLKMFCLFVCLFYFKTASVNTFFPPSELKPFIQLPNKHSGPLSLSCCILFVWTEIQTDTSVHISL